MLSVICAMMLGTVVDPMTVEISEKTPVRVYYVIDDNNAVAMIVRERETVTKKWAAVEGFTVEHSKDYSEMIWLQFPTKTLEEGSIVKELTGRYLIQQGTKQWAPYDKLPCYRLADPQEEADIRKRKPDGSQQSKNRQLSSEGVTCSGGSFYLLTKDTVYIKVGEGRIVNFPLDSVSKEDQEWIIRYFRRRQEPMKSAQ